MLRYRRMKRKRAGLNNFWRGKLSIVQTLLEMNRSALNVFLNLAMDFDLIHCRGYFTGVSEMHGRGELGNFPFPTTFVFVSWRWGNCSLPICWRGRSVMGTLTGAREAHFPTWRFGIHTSCWNLSAFACVCSTWPAWSCTAPSRHRAPLPVGHHVLHQGTKAGCSLPLLGVWFALSGWNSASFFPFFF